MKVQTKIIYFLLIVLLCFFSMSWGLYKFYQQTNELYSLNERTKGTRNVILALKNYNQETIKLNNFILELLTTNSGLQLPVTLLESYDISEVTLYKKDILVYSNVTTILNVRKGNYFTCKNNKIYYTSYITKGYYSLSLTRQVTTEALSGF